MIRKLIALVLTFLLGIALASILRKRPRHSLSRDLRALQLRMPEGCQYAPAMDLDYDIPPRIFCDRDLPAIDWQKITGYAYVFFTPGISMGT